jgi:dihydroorotase
LETAFPILYTELVKKGVISLEKLVRLLTVNPRRRFGLPLSEGLSVWDLDAEYEIDPMNSPPWSCHTL